MVRLTLPNLALWDQERRASAPPPSDRSACRSAPAGGPRRNVPDMSDLTSENGAAVEIVSEFVNEATKAVVVMIGLDPFSAAVAGGAASSLVKGLDRLRSRGREQLMEFAEAATDEYGEAFEKLVEAALDDDRKLDLLRRALEAAYKTADLQRVRFYGRLVAEGVLADDDALVDAKERVLSSLATLDPPDLKVLLHMSTADGWKKHFHEGNSKTVAVDLPEVAPVLDAVFARLEFLGLISSAGEGGLSFGAQWHVTEFGRLCIAELRRLSESAT